MTTNGDFLNSTSVLFSQDLLDRIEGLFCAASRGTPLASTYCCVLLTKFVSEKQLRKMSEGEVESLLQDLLEKGLL